MEELGTSRRLSCGGFVSNFNIEKKWRQGGGLAEPTQSKEKKKEQPDSAGRSRNKTNPSFQKKYRDKS